MTSIVKPLLCIFICSLIGIWVAFSQTVIDPVDALFEQFDRAKALFEKNPNQAHQDLADIQMSLTSLKDPTIGAADLWHEIGRFYYDQNANYAKALVCFNSAWAIRQKRLANDPNNNDLARNQFMIGTVYEYLGYNDSALVHIQKAADISEAGNNDFMLAKEYLEFGNIFDKLGNYDQSIVYYERAYPHILKGQKDQANLLSQYFKRLASLYLAKEEQRKSINHNLLALRILKDSINPTVANFFNAEIAGCYINMNVSYRTLNQPDSALFCIQQALIFYKKSQSPTINTRIGNVYYQMGNLFLQQGKPSEAQEQYQKVIDILAKNSPNHPLLSASYSDIGAGLLRKNKPTEALAYFDKALKVLIPTIPASVKDLTTVSDIALTAFAGIARSQKAMNQPQKAMISFRQLDTLISDMRTSFKEDGSKFDLSKQALPIYENAIETALSIGDTAAALDFCERNKAVVLREVLQETNAKQSLKIDPSVSAHEKQLRERIAYYQKQRFDANDSLRGIWQDSIQRTKSALEVLIKQLERTEPDYFKQKYAPIRSLTIADIQKDLPPDMLFLEYFMGDNRLFIFAIAKNKVAVYPLTLQSLPVPDKTVLPIGLHDSVSVFLKNIKNTSPDATVLNRCASTSYALYNWLLRQPLEDFNANGHITRLRIVPDGILNYIPFDALIEQPTTDLKRRDVAYILKKYAVSYIFSNQLLNPTTRKTNWSAFNQTNFGGFGIGYKNTPLSTLPFAESEVEQLQYTLGGDAFTQTKNKPLRAIFIKKATNYSILHLSMHGTVDDQEPMKSALQFVNEQDSLDPLSVIDVNNLSLAHNELTVLSACNTGTGVLQRGEGIMSLSRAFTQAGCRALVMSLWTLQDAYTTEIVTLFYDNLTKQQPKDIALAEAKRQFLAADQSERRAPNYWASLVVIGSIEKIEVSAAHSHIWLVGVLGVFLCLGVWLWLKKRK
jgi:CHAT domain-containing protein